METKQKKATKRGSSQEGTSKTGSSQEGSSKPGSQGGPNLAVLSIEGAPQGSAKGTGITAPKPKRNRSGAAKAKIRRLRLVAQSTGQGSDDGPNATSKQGGGQGSGTKRIRSEGSTPGSKEGATAKRPRASGDKPGGPGKISYSAATSAGLGVTIVTDTHPATIISEPQTKAIMAALNATIDLMEGDHFPRFGQFRWSPDGTVTVKCEDQWTLNWLEGAIPQTKPWEGASLRVLRYTPRVVKMVAVVHGLPDDTATILKRLHRQNPGLRTNLWRTYHRREEPNRLLMVFGVDEASSEVLQRQKYKAYAGVSLVTFVTKTKAPAAPEKVKEATTSAREDSATTSSLEEAPAPEATVSATSSEEMDREVSELMALVAVDDTPSGTRDRTPSKED